MSGVWLNTDGEAFTLEAFKFAIDAMRQPSYPSSLVLSPSAYALHLELCAEAVAMEDRRLARMSTFVPGADVRKAYGWTRKRWVRQRKMHNRKRRESWAAPWAEDVQRLASEGSPPWHLRNTPETRERDRRQRIYEADTYDERDER